MLFIMIKPDTLIKDTDSKQLHIQTPYFFFLIKNPETHTGTKTESSIFNKQTWLNFLSTRISQIVVTPVIKLDSLIPHNYNFATIVSHNKNIYYARDLILNPCERIIQLPKMATTHMLRITDPTHPHNMAFLDGMVCLM